MFFVAFVTRFFYTLTDIYPNNFHQPSSWLPLQLNVSRYVCAQRLTPVRIPGLCIKALSPFECSTDIHQSTADFFAPFIVDDSYDQSTFVGEQFGDQFFFDSFAAKQSMGSQRDMMGKTHNFGP